MCYTICEISTLRLSTNINHKWIITGSSLRYFCLSLCPKDLYSQITEFKSHIEYFSMCSMLPNKHELNSFNFSFDFYLLLLKTVFNFYNTVKDLVTELYPIKSPGTLN